MNKRLTIILTVLLIILAGVIAAKAQPACTTGKTVSLKPKHDTCIALTSATDTGFTFAVAKNQNRMVIANASAFSAESNNVCAVTIQSAACTGYALQIIHQFFIHTS